MTRVRLASTLMGAFLVVTAVWSAPPPAAAQTSLAPFGLSCTPEEGVRFCGGNGTTERVPSWDGIPIDVDVTLPAEGDGPWPLIVLIQGLGGDKSQLQPNTPQQDGVAPRILPILDFYNNLFYARNGYATMSLTLRGFGESCGGGGAPGAYAQPAPCDMGFTRLADTRFEARDIQHLVGLLVDDGVAKADAIGATGFSYGGGITTQLAFLRDRVRCPGYAVADGDPCDGIADGDYVPWTSPEGTPVEIAAAYPTWQWSDFVGSLLPNGRYLDDDHATVTDSLDPIGVFTQSYGHALFGLMATEGYVLEPQLPGSDLAPWDLGSAIAALDQGEPYGDDVQTIIDGFDEFQSGIRLGGTPAPTLVQDGWNDDLFPASEAIKVYREALSSGPDAEVAMLLGPVGHGRDNNKPQTGAQMNALAFDWFNEHLMGIDGALESGSVVTWVTTCPATPETADVGPFVAPSWEQMHPTSVVFEASEPQVIDSTLADPSAGQQYDPIFQTNPLGTPDSCKSIQAPDESGSAVLTGVSDGFTMVGLPTVTADITTTGTGGQLVGKLWHVLDDGTQRLITRGVYRLTDDQTGSVRFQLHGDGYEFPEGDTIKLELAPADAPQYRASNGSFTVDVTNLSLELPELSVAAATLDLPDDEPAQPDPDNVGADTTDGGGSPTPVTGGRPLTAAALAALLAAGVMSRRSSTPAG